MILNTPARHLQEKWPKPIAGALKEPELRCFYLTGTFQYFLNSVSLLCIPYNSH